jgi:hypothetical protein
MEVAGNSPDQLVEGCSAVVIQSRCHRSTTARHLDDLRRPDHHHDVRGIAVRGQLGGDAARLAVSL